jgi:hypothetical protein
MAVINMLIHFNVQFVSIKKLSSQEIVVEKLSVKIVMFRRNVHFVIDRK